MGRFSLHFLFATVSVSALKMLIYPEKDLWLQLGLTVGGFVCVFLLGFEVFLHALAPTEGESRGIVELLRRDSSWKKRLIILGWASGIIAATAFFVVGSRTDGNWVAGIPIAIFFAFFFFLQYVVPRLLLSKTPEQNEAEQGVDDQAAAAVDSKPQ
jgi:hypothetical protein